MVRRTKEEALATRGHILDTAELVFQRQGVSKATLNDIAQAAGVTRGAIYWHFRDKADLFDAMMERVRLPMEEEALCRGGPPSAEPIEQLRRNFIAVLRKTVDDPQVRRVFEIATHKVEYVGELESLRERHAQARNECVAHIQTLLRRAVELQQLPAGRATRAAALGLHALIDGLFHDWLLDPASFDLVRVGREVLDNYLAGLSATAVPAPAASPRPRSTRLTAAAPPRRVSRPRAA